jgi:hypothetical protein
MHDRRDERSDRDRSRHDHDGEHRRRGDHSGRDRRGERGRGSDTRFLQLEMSEVLYAEAESVTKRAFRELLLEEAKARFRERFGDQITGLAELAVDELMQDIVASLEIEARIRHRNRDEEGRRERLAGILKTARDRGPERDERQPNSNDERDDSQGPEPEEEL